MIDNTDLLDRMANSLVIAWPLESATELTEKMLTVLLGNEAEIPEADVRAAVDRAIDKFDSTNEAREARRKISYHLDPGRNQ